MEEINPGKQKIRQKSVPRLVADFTKDSHLRGMTDESIRRYNSCLRVFLDFLAKNNINLFNVSREDLRDFISHLRDVRNNSQGTIENDFTALSSFYDYLAYEGYVDANIVLPVRKRYIRSYKEEDDIKERQCPGIEEMAEFIESIPNTRDKAMALLLAKTGLRRNEMIHIDIDDIDFEKQSLILKKTKKRSNRVVFFDDECMRALLKWLDIREHTNAKSRALFLNSQQGRLNRQGVYQAITKWAKLFGLHNPKSPKLEERFSPHCFRHWFTTHLIRAGMRREYIKELRGDARRDAMDLYNHIDKEELKKAYLAHIPKLGIT